MIIHGYLGVINRKTGAIRASYPINKDVTTIGRDGTCDMRMMIRSIPLLQCKITTDGNQTHVENIAEEPMYVDNEQVKQGERKILHDGQTLCIGIIHLKYSATPPETPHGHIMPTPKTPRRHSESADVEASRKSPTPTPKHVHLKSTRLEKSHISMPVSTASKSLGSKLGTPLRLAVQKHSTESHKLGTPLRLSLQQTPISQRKQTKAKEQPVLSTSQRKATENSFPTRSASIATPLRKQLVAKAESLMKHRFKKPETALPTPMKKELLAKAHERNKNFNTPLFERKRITKGFKAELKLAAQSLEEKKPTPVQNLPVLDSKFQKELKKNASKLASERPQLPNQSLKTPMKKQLKEEAVRRAKNRVTHRIMDDGLQKGIQKRAQKVQGERHDMSSMNQLNSSIQLELKRRAGILRSRVEQCGFDSPLSRKRESKVCEDLEDTREEEERDIREEYDEAAPGNDLMFEQEDAIDDSKSHFSEDEIAVEQGQFKEDLLEDEDMPAEPLNVAFQMNDPVSNFAHEEDDIDLAAGNEDAQNEVHSIREEQNLEEDLELENEFKSNLAVVEGESDGEPEQGNKDVTGVLEQVEEETKSESCYSQVEEDRSQENDDVLSEDLNILQEIEEFILDLAQDTGDIKQGRSNEVNDELDSIQMEEISESESAFGVEQEENEVQSDFVEKERHIEVGQDVIEEVQVENEYQLDVAQEEGHIELGQSNIDVLDVIQEENEPESDFAQEEGHVELSQDDDDVLEVFQEENETGFDVAQEEGNNESNQSMELVQEENEPESDVSYEEGHISLNQDDEYVLEEVQGENEYQSDVGQEERHIERDQGNDNVFEHVLEEVQVGNDSQTVVGQKEGHIELGQGNENVLEIVVKDVQEEELIQLDFVQETKDIEMDVALEDEIAEPQLDEYVAEIDVKDVQGYYSHPADDEEDMGQEEGNQDVRAHDLDIITEEDVIHDEEVIEQVQDNDIEQDEHIEWDVSENESVILTVAMIEQFEEAIDEKIQDNEVDEDAQYEESGSEDEECEIVQSSDDVDDDVFNDKSLDSNVSSNKVEDISAIVTERAFTSLQVTDFIYLNSDSISSRAVETQSELLSLQENCVEIDGSTVLEETSLSLQVSNFSIKHSNAVSGEALEIQSDSFSVQEDYVKSDDSAIVKERTSSLQASDLSTSTSDSTCKRLETQSELLSMNVNCVNINDSTVEEEAMSPKSQVSNSSPLKNDSVIDEALEIKFEPSSSEENCLDSGAHASFEDNGTVSKKGSKDRVTSSDVDIGEQHDEAIIDDIEQDGAMSINNSPDVVAKRTRARSASVKSKEPVKTRSTTRSKTRELVDNKENVDGVANQLVTSKPEEKDVEPEDSVSESVAEETIDTSSAEKTKSVMTRGRTRSRLAEAPVKTLPRRSTRAPR